MRLQELFETTEEDRALISLSSSIYGLLTPYIGEANITYDDAEQKLVHIGKIGDMFDTPITALADVNIDLQRDEPFWERSKDSTSSDEFDGSKQILAFWDEPTKTIVLNLDHISTNRMKTTITHELRHALDEAKSGSFPPSPRNKTPDTTNRYFTPKKKEHRKSDPYSTVQYRAMPAEINARFVEILDILANRMIPRRYGEVAPHLIKRQLSRDFNNLLVKYEIADLFPEKTASKDYKRLIKRAYDFMQKEVSHFESTLAQTSDPVVATGTW